MSAAPRIDNAGAIPGGPLDLQLTDVTEAQALTTLLRDANVVVVGRAQPERSRRHASSASSSLREGRALPSPFRHQRRQRFRRLVHPQRRPVAQPIIGLNGLPVPDDQQ